MTSRRYPIPTRKGVPRHVYAPAKPRRVRSRPWALAALIALTVVALISAGAPLLTSRDPGAMAPKDQFLPPAWDHPAGTDLFGRDLATRLLYGGRYTLGIAAAAVLLALLPGTLLGLAAGYFGGWTDRLISWLVDVILAFPSILLALIIVAALGPGIANVILAVGISGLPQYTRLVRAQVLSARRAAYVRAAITVGCTHGRIIFRHILPNLLGSIIVLATLNVGGAILNASALSFLGLGVQPPIPEWGSMLNEGRGFLRDAPWMTLFPGTAIALTVLAVNILGDALRDALDPRQRRR